MIRKSIETHPLLKHFRLIRDGDRSAVLIAVTEQEIIALLEWAEIAQADIHRLSAYADIAKTQTSIIALLERVAILEKK